MNVPPKAYENPEFLHSPSARTIRIMCEYYEPLSRFQKYGIERTLVFFGSARTKSMEIAQRNYDEMNHIINTHEQPSREMLEKFEAAKIDLRMSRYYEDARQLARKLTEWSNSLGSGKFIICSGGGPGIMEAANRGAAEAGGRSIGLNISLPFEQSVNPFVSEELTMQFHYFFMRKFWFVHLACALAVFPGGFGTFDELMEVLTLTQTRKIGRRIPILIYGSDFWNEVIDFNALVKWRVISKEDIDLFGFADTVDDAFRYLKTEIEKVSIHP